MKVWLFCVLTGFDNGDPSGSHQTFETTKIALKTSEQMSIWGGSKLTPGETDKMDFSALRNPF